MFRSAAVFLIIASLAGATACSSELRVPRSGDKLVSTEASLGTPVQFFGVAVTVVRFRSTTQSSERFPRIVATVRTVSSADRSRTNPSMELRCDESEGGGGEWFRTSTWEPEGFVDPSERLEGDVTLGFPPKPNAPRYPVATCTNAVVVVGEDDPDVPGRRVEYRYTVPTSVVAEAIAAARE